MAQPKVLMIGLDAAEPSLIEKWCADGTLPNLRRLRDRGAYTRLKSSAEWLVGSPWPTFYTGTTPAEHGFYHYLMWRPEAMRVERPNPRWRPLRPFWRAIGEHGPRAIAVDIPLAYEAEPFNGIEINGWASHDLLVPPYAFPPSILPWVRKTVGPPPRVEEAYQLTSPHGLLVIRDELIEGTRRVTELCAALMKREAWDLFLLAYGATHRGGHKLWNLCGVEGEATEPLRSELIDALRQVYVAADANLARLVDLAGPDTTVMVFSLHGMGANTCRTELLDEMLKRILAGGPPEVSEAGPRKPGLLKRLRGAVPVEWRYAVKRRLPLVLQDKLTAFWRVGNIDWSNTRAVSMVADLQGYIRINLKGREPQGIVEPGAEYDALCATIEEGLRSFTDADTGTPIVEGVMRRDALYPEGACASDLPDLLVRWADTPVAEHRAIESPRFGRIAWPTPGKNPDGRAGNHRFEGFLIAAGGGFQGETLRGAHILDLVPTVYELFGLQPPPHMKGRSLAAPRH